MLVEAAAVLTAAGAHPLGPLSVTGNSYAGMLWHRFEGGIQETAPDHTDMCCLAGSRFFFCKITCLSLLTSRLPRWQGWSMSFGCFCY